MALSLPPMLKYPCSRPTNTSSPMQFHGSCNVSINQRIITKCESKEPSLESKSVSKSSQLEIGSPIIVIEAPKMLKTAASVPCLRVNAGLVKPGDVGRIVSRKPKDVWAVRLSIGTYLIDGKYFKALDLDN